MSFASDLDKIVRKTQGNIDLVTRKVTADLFTRVIQKTPVDTGAARGNWNASIGEYNTAYDLDKKDKAGVGAISQAVAVANQSKSGNVTYLVNSLPYIRKLEYGSSKQAPNGMVRLTVSEYEKYLREAVRNLR